MSVTYGEEMLERAEAKQRFRRARKRRLLLLGPATFAALWAMADLLAARNDRLNAADAGAIRVFVDHTEVIVWTLFFVIAPLAMAVRPEPLPSGAALAFLAGPLASPILFGAGGWKWWQSLVVTLVCALVLAGARERRKLGRTA